MATGYTQPWKEAPEGDTYFDGRLIDKCTNGDLGCRRKGWSRRPTSASAREGARERTGRPSVGAVDAISGAYVSPVAALRDSRLFSLHSHHPGRVCGERRP